MRCGKTIKLSDLKGKIVIVDFWATWRRPCQRSMPHLESVYSQVKDKNVAVLAVCVWDQKSNFDKWVTDTSAGLSLSACETRLIHLATL